MSNVAGSPDLNISELLRILMNVDIDSSQVCKVLKVDGLTCDCEPINGDAEVLGVRICADDSPDKYVLIPAEGSMVVVSFMSKTEAFVSMVSHVSKVMLKVGNTVIEYEDAPILIKRGENSLGQLMDLLIDELLKIYAPKDTGSIAQLKIKFKQLLK